MHAAFSYFATLRVPQGDAESVRKLGEYTPSSVNASLNICAGIMDITNGDAIFARDMHGSGIPVDDVIQAWVVGEYVQHDILQIQPLTDIIGICVGNAYPLT